MDSAPEIRLVHLPKPSVRGPRESEELTTPGSGDGAFAPPRARGPSIVALAALAGLAGIGAIVLGGWAAFSGSGSVRQATVVRPVDLQQGIALLAKPSTQRIPFESSGGRLILAVGSAGRAAIVLRGLERMPTGRTYVAWVVAPGVRSVRAGAFTGVERVVPLLHPVAKGSSVRVTVERVDGSGNSRNPALYVARRPL